MTATCRLLTFSLAVAVSACSTAPAIAFTAPAMALEPGKCAVAPCAWLVPLQAQGAADRQADEEEKGGLAAPSQKTSGGLRTRRLQGDRPRLLDEPFETPRQLLTLLDIGESDLSSFVDGQPITASDEEAFLKTLFRMPQIGADDIARWLRDPVSWQDLEAAPEKFRAEFFRVRGRVGKVTRRPVRKELAELFAFDYYYEATVSVDGAYEVTVCARTVPRAWSAAGRLDQRCEASAMFLKLGAPTDSRPHFLFVTPRIAWLPDRTDRRLGIGADQVLLGELGMDIGLFDPVRERNGRSIQASERECFYALLAAARRATPQQMAQHASKLQLEPLLKQPQQMHGEVIRVRGSVRRITRVEVDERDIQTRFGIDHYFQLDVLVPLDGAEVQIKGDKPGDSGPVYRSNFPFTFCTLSIPSDWESMVGRERTSVRAVLDGFFFKLWAYSNPYVASFDEEQRQLSPMLILHSPSEPPSSQSGRSPLNIALGAGFLVVLAGIWVAVWFLNRADQRRGSGRKAQRLADDEAPDFTNLG